MSEISPIWPTGCKASSCAYVATGFIGDLMIPGATAFTLIPRLAYSIASDLVAAGQPALRKRREHRGYAGDRVIDQARRYPHEMAAALLLHLGDGELRDVKKPGDVDAQDRHVVGLDVLGERFGDEDAGVVDERVDPPEPGHPFKDRTLGRLPIGDIAGHREDLIIVRRSDRARGRDDPVVAIAVRPDEGPRRCPARHR